MPACTTGAKTVSFSLESANISGIWSSKLQETQGPSVWCVCHGRRHTGLFHASLDRRRLVCPEHPRVGLGGRASGSPVLPGPAPKRTTGLERLQGRTLGRHPSIPECTAILERKFSRDYFITILTTGHAQPQAGNVCLCSLCSEEESEGLRASS